ncbi:MAG: hypothetical protein KDB01_22065, partial [Planctomycetaceae bacterium]|nr:hypothetical protein [Planctomycetaceae bacterium]
MASALLVCSTGEGGGRTEGTTSLSYRMVSASFDFRRGLSGNNVSDSVVVTCTVHGISPRDCRA